MDATVYNQDGKKKGSVTLPETVFGAAWKADLVHQVITSMQSNDRAGLAHTKGRGEVSGGGKKPWRQKGTGRARHGSSRSPIWVGGGITHGPRNEKRYDKVIPRRMKGAALASILSKKYGEGEVLFVDGLKLSGKTKEAVEVIDALSGVKGFENLSGKKRNALLLALPELPVSSVRAFQNIGNVLVTTTGAVNPLQLMTYRFVAFVSPDEAVATLQKRVAPPIRRKEVKK